MTTIKWRIEQVQPIGVNKRVVNGNVTIAHLERMCIPKVHYDARLSEIPDKLSHKVWIEDWIRNLSDNIRQPKGLLLTGPYSAGKSAIGAICLKAAAANGFIGLWITARRLPEYQIEKTWFDDEMTLIHRARTVPLLVIDEVQIRDSVAGTEQALESLIRHRVDERLCTILTTNHSVADLDKKYPALVAPLKQALIPVAVVGIDFRARIAESLINDI